uniref:Uncharacterized protein n=1 Tax=Anopheles dirus TaxID=7168 RepID=A0A182N3X6_9DIPT
MSSSPRLTGYTLRPSETSTTVSVTLNSCGTGIKKLSINDSVKSAGSANSGGESTDPLESDFSGEEEEEEEEEEEDERDLHDEDEDDENDKEDEEAEEEEEDDDEQDSVRQDRRKGESVRLRLAVGEKANKNSTKRQEQEDDDDDDDDEDDEDENSDSEKDLRRSPAVQNSRKQPSTSSADGDEDDRDEQLSAPGKTQPPLPNRNGVGNARPRGPAADADDGDDHRCGRDSDDDGGDLSDKNNNIDAAVRRKQPEDYALDDFQILKTI